MHSMSTDEAAEMDGMYNDRYAKHGKCFEAEHNGEFLAISSEGKTILGPTLVDVADRASERFGPATFFYRVGQRAVFRLL